MKKSTAPQKLSKESKLWWTRLVEEYDIRDPGGELLLETALTALDRMREAQRQLEQDGSVLTDRFGQKKAHPATVLERDSRAGLISALRQLNLDIEPLRDRPGRPAGG